MSMVTWSIILYHDQMGKMMICTCIICTQRCDFQLSIWPQGKSWTTLQHAALFALIGRSALCYECLSNSSIMWCMFSQLLCVKAELVLSNRKVRSVSDSCLPWVSKVGSLLIGSRRWFASGSIPEVERLKHIKNWHLFVNVHSWFL
jgi:hypothetical protein